METVFSTSRSRVDLAQEMEEKENEEYAAAHNLHALFSEFATILKERKPQTEQDAERVLLELLAQRKGERDRAALRLHYQKSFEVNIDNGKKILKLTLGQDGGEISVSTKSRSQVSHSFSVTIEQIEELNERLYELGRFIVESTKGGETGGFVCVDDGEVYFLCSSKECTDVGNELIHFSLFLNVPHDSKEEEKV